MAELAYGEQVVADLKAHDFLGEYAEGRSSALSHRHPQALPQPGPRDRPLMESGWLFADLGLPDLDAENALTG